MGRRSVAKLERNLDHVDAYFGSMLASKLTSDRIVEYRKSRAKQGTRQPTIDHEMRSLKTAVRFAFAHGKLRRLPVFTLRTIRTVEMKANSAANNSRRCSRSCPTI